MAAEKTVRVRVPGLVLYEPVFKAMKTFTAQRTAGTPDEIWLVEHEPVFTLGASKNRSHLLNTQDVPVIQTDRGGDVTYHAPGQAVLYLLLDIRRGNSGRWFAKEVVTQMEEAIVDTLKKYQITGERRPGARGIYVSAYDSGHADYQKWAGAKIAAIGLKVSKNGCVYHGLSLNVSMDIEPFSWINPCGEVNVASVDMKTLGKDASVSDVQQDLLWALGSRLGLELPLTDFSDLSEDAGFIDELNALA